MKPILDHIGIAVDDLDAAVELYGKLGFVTESVDDVPGFGVKVAFLPLVNGNIELVQPVSDNSAIARFLSKKGPGFHHICLRVDDIWAELGRLKGLGVQVVDQEPREGAHGALVAFLHPKSTGGVLIELVQHGKAVRE